MQSPGAAARGFCVFLCCRIGGAAVSGSAPCPEQTLPNHFPKRALWFSEYRMYRPAPLRGRSPFDGKKVLLIDEKTGDARRCERTFCAVTASR